MSQDGEMHAMSRAIGDLEATVRSLTDTWSQQDQHATEGRRLLHAKVDTLTSTIQTTNARLDTLTGRFAEIEPAVRRFEVARQRAEGARSLAKLLWAGFVAFAAGLGYLASDLMHLLWPPKH